VRALPQPGLRRACPSGAIYKREEDGIVLIDQEKCRGWRMCVSGCPYKKIYYNWSIGQIREVHLLLSAHRGGQPTVCSETCVGRIRYLGVHALRRRPHRRGCRAPDEKDLYEAQLKVFLDPNDPKVIAAGAQGRHSRSWLEGARNSPVYKMAMEWKVAFPLHPEYRTLPMVWYVPPLSPMQSRGRGSGKIGVDRTTCRTCVRCVFRCATSPTC
jgi:nitrate reductase beta subunit